MVDIACKLALSKPFGVQHLVLGVLVAIFALVAIIYEVFFPSEIYTGYWVGAMSLLASVTLLWLGFRPAFDCLVGTILVDMFAIVISALSLILGLQSAGISGFSVVHWMSTLILVCCFYSLGLVYAQISRDELPKQPELVLKPP